MYEEDDFLAVMDLRASWQNREWGDFWFGVGMWAIILVLLLHQRHKLRRTSFGDVVLMSLRIVCMQLGSSLDCA